MGVRACIDLNLDIREEAEKDLLYRSILEASADCIAVLSLDGRLEIINETGRSQLGLPHHDCGLGVLWTDLWPKRVRGRISAALNEARGGNVARLSVKRPAKSATAVWWDVVITPIRGSSGDVSRVLLICRDVTPIKAATEQMKWASSHDALTKLANRSAFHARLQAATLRAMHSGQAFGLLLLDLDHFKHVNDTLGHAAGDLLLQNLADRLRTSIRSSDYAARLGGDEFAILIESMSDDTSLLRTAKALIARLNAPVFVGDRTVSAGVSIGAALFPRDAATAQELLNNADNALYAVKSGGRGCVKMFHGHMRERAQQIASQLSLARIAINKDSVLTHYQPKVNLLSGRVSGYEALLRWIHPSRGVQSPGTIHEAFGDYELASKIGELVQCRVLRDIGLLLQTGLDLAPVSINASPAEFLHDDYAERLLDRIAAENLNPNRLEIEVTEHVFLDRTSDYVARALHVLKKEGVRIALDDFGTGYSSLSHLRDFPVDVVKIDRSFIEGMTHNEEMSAIVSAVIGLARSLSLEVIAEGVETRDQERLLIEKGCSHAQGFFYGRPMDTDHILGKLKRLEAA